MQWGLPFEKGHSNYPDRISYSTTRKYEAQEGPECQGEGLKFLKHCGFLSTEQGTASQIILKSQSTFINCRIYT